MQVYIFKILLYDYMPVCHCDENYFGEISKEIYMKRLFSLVLYVSLLVFLLAFYGCEKDSSTGLDNTAPEKPTGLKASIEETYIQLTWDENTEEDLAGYNIYRSKISGSEYAKINSEIIEVSKYPTFIDTFGLIKGTTYYYVISAIDNFENESEISGEIDATFHKALYTLTIDIDKSDLGMTDPEEGEYIFEEGDEVPIKAIPEYGCIFLHWTGGVDDSLSSTTTVIMDKDITVMALFYEIKMVSIFGGTFNMGSNFEDSPDNPNPGSGTFDKERPIHPVSLDSFEMSIYEVTNAQYVDYLNNAKASNYIKMTNSSVIGNYGRWIDKNLLDFNEIRYSGSRFLVDESLENYPVTNVSWYGAKAFAEYYDLDLPTEAEWEYACRAGSETHFNTGNDLSNGKRSSDLENAGWYEYNSNGKSHPVGQKEPNAWGLYDMHGNVYEFCCDYCDHDYYSNSPSENPINEVDAYQGHIVRGGCYEEFGVYGVAAAFCRSACRFLGCNSPDGHIGFRVVRRPDGVKY